MARTAQHALRDSLALIGNYSPAAGSAVLGQEDRLDRYEDLIGSYLVKLSAHETAEADSLLASMLLHLIGDFERIGDHAVNITEAAQELYDKKLTFSEQAAHEVAVLSSAVSEALELAMKAFETGDASVASRVEPLEQVVDDLTKELKRRHISRLQAGICTIELGFILSDVISNCERVADHCSNIAATLIELARGSFETHGYTGHISDSPTYHHRYLEYSERYSLEG